MRHTIYVLIAAALLTASAAAQQKPSRAVVQVKPTASADTPAPQVKDLTNDEVIQMVQGGLGESVVIAAIRNAKATAFDVAPMTLLMLKKSGVSDAIVSVMIDPKAATAATSPGVAGSPLMMMPNADTRARIDSPTASPEIPRESGIYWDRGRDGAHDLVGLEPTVFSAGKTGGFLTSALTYGIKKIQIKAVTRGSSAVLHIDEPSPTFYFYFENKTTGLGGGGFAGWLSGATSPNEFVLARMISKKNERQLIVGEANFLGGSSGTRSKDTEDIKIDRLSGGIYRVRPLHPLELGEYCFFYAGGISALATPGQPGGASGGRLFDFGIYEGK